MNVVGAKRGELSARVPDVVLDRRVIGIKRTLIVTIDGVRVPAREERIEGARILTFKIPEGTRTVQISGGQTGFR